MAVRFVQNRGFTVVQYQTQQSFRFETCGSFFAMSSHTRQRQNHTIGKNASVAEIEGS